MSTTASSSVWLPPEIWRICLRWATLPRSGRSPLDEPRTCLDPWYLPCITPQLFADMTAQSDALEQESVYPVKRAVVLVCKAWNDMATEYLYEHIVYRPSARTGSLGALIKFLQYSPKGEQLARMSTLLRLCPNLQSIYTNSRHVHVHFPYPYSLGGRNLPTLSIVSELLQSPAYQPFWSRAHYWHYLTVYFDIPKLSGDLGVPMAQKNILPPPPDSGGKEFINLRHLSFVSKGTNRYSIRNLKHWPLPSITHLTIKSYIPGTGGSYDEILDVLQSSRLGSQLKFFALLVHGTTPSCNTTVRGSLELLNAMPNLKEVALPFFWDSDQLPITTVTFPKVHTMGMETNRLGYTSIATPENILATYTETCCRLFPNMRKIRSMPTASAYTVDFFLKRAGPRNHFKTAASILKNRGITFEDCAGWDITQILF